MNHPYLLLRDPESHSLAKHLPSGKILEQPNGRLRIEGEEAQMEQLMSEVDAAYYRGMLDIDDVEVVIVPPAALRGLPLGTLSATA